MADDFLIVLDINPDKVVRGIKQVTELLTKLRTDVGTTNTALRNIGESVGRGFTKVNTTLATTLSTVQDIHVATTQTSNNLKNLSQEARAGFAGVNTSIEGVKQNIRNVSNVAKSGFTEVNASISSVRKSIDDLSMIASNASKQMFGVTKAMNDAVNAANRVSAKMNSVQSSLKSLNNTVSSIKTNMATMGTSMATVGRGVTGIEKAVVRTSAAVQTLGMRWRFFYYDTLRAKNVLMGVFASGLIIRGIRALVRQGSDAQETYAKFNVVFENTLNIANKAADNLVKNYRLANSTAKDMLANSAALLYGFGLTEKESAKMSAQIQVMASDLAYFTNYEGRAAGASVALTKAIYGRREMAKRLGIAITETMVKDRMAILVQQGLAKSSYQATKAFATLQIMQEQSAKAYGHTARESGHLASAVDRLKAAFIQLKENMGTSILSISTKLIDAMASFVNTLSKIPKPIMAIMVSLAGLSAIGIGIVTTVVAIKVVFESFNKLIHGTTAAIQENSVSEEENAVAVNITSNALERKISLNNAELASIKAVTAALAEQNGARIFNAAAVPTSFVAPPIMNSGKMTGSAYASTLKNIKTNGYVSRQNIGAQNIDKRVSTHSMDYIKKQRNTNLKQLLLIEQKNLSAAKKSYALRVAYMQNQLAANKISAPTSSYLLKEAKQSYRNRVSGTLKNSQVLYNRNVNTLSQSWLDVKRNTDPFTDTRLKRTPASDKALNSFKSKRAKILADITAKEQQELALANKTLVAKEKALSDQLRRNAISKATYDAQLYSARSTYDQRVVGIGKSAQNQIKNNVAPIERQMERVTPGFVPVGARLANIDKRGQNLATDVFNARKADTEVAKMSVKERLNEVSKTRVSARSKAISSHDTTIAKMNKQFAAAQTAIMANKSLSATQKTAALTSLSNSHSSQTAITDKGLRTELAKINKSAKKERNSVIKEGRSTARAIRYGSELKQATGQGKLNAESYAIRRKEALAAGKKLDDFNKKEYERASKRFSDTQNKIQDKQLKSIEKARNKTANKQRFMKTEAGSILTRDKSITESGIRQIRNDANERIKNAKSLDEAVLIRKDAQERIATERANLKERERVVQRELNNGLKRTERNLNTSMNRIAKNTERAFGRVGRLMQAEYGHLDSNNVLSRKDWASVRSGNDIQRLIETKSASSVVTGPIPAGGSNVTRRQSPRRRRSFANRMAVRGRGIDRWARGTTVKKGVFSKKAWGFSTALGLKTKPVKAIKRVTGNGIKSVAKTVGKSTGISFLLKKIAPVLSPILPMFSKLLGLFGTLGHVFKAVIIRIIPGIGWITAIGTAIWGLGKLFKLMPKWLEMFIENVWPKIKDGVSKIWDNLPFIAAKVFKTILDSIVSIAQGIGSIVARIFGFRTDAQSNYESERIKKAREKENEITERLTTAEMSLLQIREESARAEREIALGLLYNLSLLTAKSEEHRKLIEMEKEYEEKKKNKDAVINDEVMRDAEGNELSDEQMEAVNQETNKVYGDDKDNLDPEERVSAIDEALGLDPQGNRTGGGKYGELDRLRGQSAGRTKQLEMMEKIHARLDLARTQGTGLVSKVAMSDLGYSKEEIESVIGDNSTVGAAMSHINASRKAINREQDADNEAITDTQTEINNLAIAKQHEQGKKGVVAETNEFGDKVEQQRIVTEAAEKEKESKESYETGMRNVGSIPELERIGQERTGFLSERLGALKGKKQEYDDDVASLNNINKFLQSGYEEELKKLSAQYSNGEITKQQYYEGSRSLNERKSESENTSKFLSNKILTQYNIGEMQKIPELEKELEDTTKSIKDKGLTLKESLFGQAMSTATTSRSKLDLLQNQAGYYQDQFNKAETTDDKLKFNDKLGEIAGQIGDVLSKHEERVWDVATQSVEKGSSEAFKLEQRVYASSMNKQEKMTQQLVNLQEQHLANAKKIVDNTDTKNNSYTITVQR